MEDPLRQAAGLTRHAWKFRYPGDPDEPGEAEARAALELANAVCRAILSHLPEELNPEFGTLPL